MIRPRTKNRAAVPGTDKGEQMKLKIAVAQMGAAYFEKEQNQRRVISMAEDALSRGVQLLLFPEGVNLGYFVLDRRRSVKETYALALDAADASDSPWIEELRGLAKKGMYIGCGSFLKTGEGRLVNGLLFFSPAGALHVYYKTHLFHVKEVREEDFVAKGDELSVFHQDSFSVGLSICYDLNFPEVFRTLALQGAQIILIAAAWPKNAGYVWDALLPARAIENEVCVVASNQTGGDYYGHSKIIDCTGKVLGRLDEEEDLAVAEIDLEKQEKWRRIVTYFDDRRPELYRL